MFSCLNDRSVPVSWPLVRQSNTVLEQPRTLRNKNGEVLSPPSSDFEHQAIYLVRGLYWVVSDIYVDVLLAIRASPGGDTRR